VWGRVFAFIALASVLAGCGGDDSPRGISKDEYLARADALCAKANRRAAALAMPDLERAGRNRAALRAAADWLAIQAAIGHAELTAIRDLGHIHPDDDLRDRALDAADGIISGLLIVADDALRADVAAFRRHYARLQAVTARAGALAAELGYRVCGRGGVHRSLARR
jgi:hypothetical protein